MRSVFSCLEIYVCLYRVGDEKSYYVYNISHYGENIYRTNVMMFLLISEPREAESRGQYSLLHSYGIYNLFNYVENVSHTQRVCKYVITGHRRCDYPSSTCGGCLCHRTDCI